MRSILILIFVWCLGIIGCEEVGAPLDAMNDALPSALILESDGGILQGHLPREYNNPPALEADFTRPCICDWEVYGTDDQICLRRHLCHASCLPDDAVREICVDRDL